MSSEQEQTEGSSLSTDTTQEYEENIISPPIQFRDDYKPKKPIALPRTVIEKTKQALKNYTESYKISIKNWKDPLIQLQNTRLAIKTHLKNLLKSMKGFKYVETLEVTFEKMSNNDIINKTAYFNSQILSQMIMKLLNHLNIHKREY